MERMSLNKFITLIHNCALNGKANWKDGAVLGPIIYSYEEEYFNSAVNYLETGEKTLLIEGQISIENFLNEETYNGAMSYLEALVALHNIKENPNSLHYIASLIEVE